MPQMQMERLWQNCVEINAEIKAIKKKEKKKMENKIENMEKIIYSPVIAKQLLI